MRDELTINAATLIALLAMIESHYPAKRVIHVFLDNAGYHHAKVVMAWLARPTCRIRLHYITRIRGFRATKGLCLKSFLR